MQHLSPLCAPFSVLVLCLLALLGLGKSSQAQLVAPLPITLATQVVSDWYSHLPARFQARDTITLALLNDRDMDRYLKSVGLEDGASDASDAGEGEILGLYAQRPHQARTLSLRIPRSGALDLQIVSHEWGHYLFQNALSSSQRRQWKGIWERDGGRSLGTEVARQSPDEGFAEAFAIYSQKPAVLQARCPAWFDFLERCGWNA